MGRSKSKLNKNLRKFIEALIILIFIIIFNYLSLKYNKNENYTILENSYSNELKQSNNELANKEILQNVDINNNDLNVIFLYVGQADCILLKMNDKVMLIDAGNNEDSNNISKYLKSLNINKIDYLIGTHCDEDHIGGLDDIVKDFEIDTLFLPEVGEDDLQYSNIVKNANEKNLQVSHPKSGDKFSLGNCECEVMSALNEKDVSDNNSSIVIQTNYNKKKFLFMGDAEKEVEQSRNWENVDVLKVGHHGSNTSSSEEFLNQVRPKYSVILVGKNNYYRLPNVKTISRLDNIKTNILRTDTNCTSFWFKCDGINLKENEININLDGNK